MPLSISLVQYNLAIYGILGRKWLKKFGKSLDIHIHIFLLFRFIPYIGNRFKDRHKSRTHIAFLFVYFVEHSNC